MDISFKIKQMISYFFKYMNKLLIIKLIYLSHIHDVK
jgi:hypothetical protein